MSVYEARRLLVVVKAYPNPSQAYGETVCCAGVDLATGRWVRMYPITFRRLADQRYAKYQVIECRGTRPRTDNRPESLRIDQDSIQHVGGVMPAGKAGWARRMKLLPPTRRSMEDVLDAQASDGTSIGMLRPRRIDGLVIGKAEPWSEKQHAWLAQQHLDLGERASRQLRELEQIPWTFSYRFSCDDHRCHGHKLQIIDWEIGESYRRWSRTDPERWREMIRQKYERELPEKCDLHLVVGSLAAHQRTFVIIGLVYPPRVEVDGLHVQQSLDLMGQERPVARARVGLEAEQADALPVDDRQDALELFPDES